MLGAFTCHEPCVYCLGTRQEEDLQVVTEATLPGGECQPGEQTGGHVHLSVPGTVWWGK